MNPQLTFVGHLRRTRLRKGISLDQIATQTRVKRELLEALERNDLSGWPRGLYARAWVRGYAVAVGLDPADTVDEFCRLYLHGDRRARPTMRELASIADVDSEFLDEHGNEERRRSARRAAAAQAVWYAPVLRLWHQLRVRTLNLWASMFARPGAHGRIGDF